MGWDRAKIAPHGDTPGRIRSRNLAARGWRTEGRERQNSPDSISRGLFAGEVAVPRMLKLFRRYGLRSTWFVPGHSIETFPDQCRQIVDAGHEMSIHGYSHENPLAMSRTQEAAVLDRSIELVEAVSKRQPTGYAAPWGSLSPVTHELLLERGIKYDRTFMHNDFHPYRLRAGDTWTKIDYSARASEWMKPLVRGEETDLIEIPPNWYLDDLPPMMFIKANPNSHGWVNPRQLEKMWRDQFDWVYRELDHAVFPINLHPDFSGHPQVLLMLERIIDYIKQHKSIRWVTFDEIANDFAARNPAAGAGDRPRRTERGTAPGRLSRRPAGHGPDASPPASPAPGPPGWCAPRRPGRPGAVAPWAFRPPTDPRWRPGRARSES
ncbi:polysaccharide deacetylase [Salinispora tropica CNB-440]|uniref:Polysaccharide deacetylase n=1 Tax=Salinispora tropica (strain ATCC BAA-916 / DSM 44818 / JCM 13857 / NBRC 105044 / CNB-440) TaxID=369723 RepID=A4XAZ4_SALTO|nr:polysaccharide deacetylase [Salinispora tropica CNB-440]